MTNYALTLKRAAEAGNDVYRYSQDYEDKLAVAAKVLNICDVSYLRLFVINLKI